MSTAEAVGDKTMELEASVRLGRARGVRNSLKGGSACGSQERVGGTAAEITGVGTVRTRDLGAGVEPVWIRLPQRGR